MRDPYSFAPFLLGKRVCMGKPFAELAVTSMVMMLVHSLNFTFEDQIYKSYFPNYASGGEGERDFFWFVSLK